jgi:hypothetical protein
MIKLLEMLLPEVLEFIRLHYAATGEFPTEQELIEKFTEDVDKYIAIGDKWLGEHK